MPKSKSPPPKRGSASPKLSDQNAKDVTIAEPVVNVTVTKPQPLGPPARPAASEPTDYFSGSHSTAERDPFATSFANHTGGNLPNLDTPSNGLTTPGGTRLPGIETMTSPNGFEPTGLESIGSGLTPGYGWGGMGLHSPSNRGEADTYFAARGFNGFPTPNESGMRTGMVNTPMMSPGGTGSMFPPDVGTPSGLSKPFDPRTAGELTPSTMDFHRTALSAQQRITSQPSIGQTLDRSLAPPQPIARGVPAMAVKAEPQSAHDEEAANGLYLLAHTREDPNRNPRAPYTMAPQTSIQPVHAHPPNMQMGGVQNNSPQMTHRHNGSVSTAGSADLSGSEAEQNPKKRKTRGGVKKEPATKVLNNNQKTNGAPTKGGNKKRKNIAMSASPEPEVEEEMDLSKDEFHANGKKMSDEEKRKNFLERNRVAALKCRQRKKQWLANLQNKVEIYAAENDNLNAQVSSLRDEVVTLKTMLMGHKDCPISQQQGISGGAMQQILSNGWNQQQQTYDPSVAHHQLQQHQMMVGQADRRFS